MLGIIVLTLTGALAGGFLLEKACEARDRRRYPPPGRCYDIGGRKLHLLSKGSGGPTVIIEQGAGGPSPLWWPVQEEAARFAEVCTYDRAGAGWSDPARAPRNVDERVADLHALLQASKAKPPYILVGHSYGGLLVRRFARKYPQDVAGLVLVDTFEEGAYFRDDVLKTYAGITNIIRLFGALHRIGLRRLWKTLSPDRPANLPEAAHAATVATTLRPSFYRAMVDDFESLQGMTPEERRPWVSGQLGTLPIAVVTHGVPFPGPFAVLEKYWKEGQQRLAGLSTNSKLIVAQRSNHMIQLDEVGLVVDAIREVHTAARTSRPLVSTTAANAAPA